ncbi:hypothetical protein RhiJN_17329 [Ceratobasidium sp. AG-Ba]|nr:hypothetical protein RhiJN_17329 [Ceratobasidium sp. AG-Ba]
MPYYLSTVNYHLQQLYDVLTTPVRFYLSRCCALDNMTVAIMLMYRDGWFSWGALHWLYRFRIFRPIIVIGFLKLNADVALLYCALYGVFRFIYFMFPKLACLFDRVGLVLYIGLSLETTARIMIDVIILLM